MEAIDVPVMTCWLEGHGIGGHAILVVPGTKGCWHCAYVNPQTLARDLVSNLNFLAPDQVIMRNQGDAVRSSALQQPRRREHGLDCR